MILLHMDHTNSLEQMGCGFIEGICELVSGRLTRQMAFGYKAIRQSRRDFLDSACRYFEPHCGTHFDKEE